MFTVYSLAKGSKGKLCHLESLLAEGDTDDGDAPNDTKEEPSKCRRKTGKEEPKKIADEFHEKFPPYNRACSQTDSHSETVILMRQYTECADTAHPLPNT